MSTAHPADRGLDSSVRAPAGGGKNPYFDIINTAEAFGWRAGLTSREWDLMELLLKRLSKIGWDNPVSMAVSYIAERLELTERQVWRVRASLARQGAITVRAGHPAIPGRRAQAACYVVHCDALLRPYGEVNPSSPYETAKEDAARHVTASGPAFGPALGPASGAATGPESGPICTYPPTHSLSLPDDGGHADVCVAPERNKGEIDKAVQTDSLLRGRGDDLGGRPIDVGHQLADRISKMTGVSLRQEELSTPPGEFMDVVRVCRDAGMTRASICEAAEEAIGRRTGKAVRTLRYFATWLHTAAGEAAEAEEAKRAEHDRRKKVDDEQIARTVEYGRVRAESVKPPEEDETLRRLAPGLFATDAAVEPATPISEGIESEEIPPDGATARGTALSLDEITNLRRRGARIPATAMADGNEDSHA